MRRSRNNRQIISYQLVVVLNTNKAIINYQTNNYMILSKIIDLCTNCMKLNLNNILMYLLDKIVYVSY